MTDRYRDSELFLSKKIKRYQTRYAYLLDLLDQNRRLDSGSIWREIDTEILEELATCERWLRRNGQPLYALQDTPTPFADAIRGLDLNPTLPQTNP
jgi:hypothetical protein